MFPGGEMPSITLHAVQVRQLDVMDHLDGAVLDAGHGSLTGLLGSLELVRLLRHLLRQGVQQLSLIHIWKEIYVRRFCSPKIPPRMGTSFRKGRLMVGSFPITSARSVPWVS